MHDGTTGSGCHPLKTLYFYLTGGCNLRCRHCMAGAKFQTETSSCQELEPELFLHTVRQAKPLGLFSVKLGGGEPFLHSRFGEFLEIIRRENIALNVETNGVLCTPALARELARCRLISFSVSLDGADADAHEWMRGVAGCFEAALRGIRNLVAAGIRPLIIMSVVRRNAGQMEALVRLAESLGAGAVQFNLVRPMGRGVKMQKAGEMLTINELVARGEWVETELSRQARLPVCITHPLAFRPLERMCGERGTGTGGCGILNLMGILADGSYALCGIGAEVPDLVFGHAGRNTLEEVWQDHPVLRELRKGIPGRLKGICGECLMKGVCQGHCLAQNYVRARDFWAPYWFCEEADREGLFPDSRKQFRPDRTLQERMSGQSRERIEETFTCG
jgi:SynChlorMet cassette radical SAM/SPASM protein ScmF